MSVSLGIGSRFPAFCSPWDARCLRLYHLRNSRNISGRQNFNVSPDEWQFVLSGRARVMIFGAHGRTKTGEFGQGEVGFVKQGFGQYIEQVGSEPLQMLLIFNSPVYEKINLSTWLAANPAIESEKALVRDWLLLMMAMIIGMIPMALGLREGGEQNAPWAER